MYSLYFMVLFQIPGLKSDAVAKVEFNSLQNEMKVRILRNGQFNSRTIGNMNFLVKYLSQDLFLHWSFYRVYFKWD